MTIHWTTLLDEFQQAVKEKKYTKVPYDHWRNMKQRDCWVTCIKDIKNQQVRVMFEEEEVFTRDYPFGQFLWDRFPQTGDDALPSAINNVKDSLGALAESVKTVATIKDNYDCAYGAWNITPTLEVTSNSLKLNGKTLEEIIDKTMGNSINDRKEKDNMDLIKNFDFGSCANDRVKVSMYGIAVQNANGTWVSYDPKSGSVIDVDILNFNAKYLYKMPTTIKDIKVSDVIIHNRKPMFVTGVEEGKLLVIDPAAGEEKIVLPTKSMFGFDFITRVVNLFGDAFNGASADAPFGNMLPMLMLADGGKTDDILPLMFAMGDGKIDMSNPMMMYFLMKNGDKSNDMLPLYFFMNGSYLGPNNPKTCNCGDCGCDKTAQ